MPEELGPKSAFLDHFHQQLEETDPERFSEDPYRCACCGEYIYSGDVNSDEPELLIVPVILPPETIALMENGTEENLPANTGAIKLQFCKHHLKAMEYWMGSPGAVSFRSFNAKYVVESTSDNDVPKSKWDQSTLRLARDRLRRRKFDGEPEEIDQRELVQATLLVAAVDEFGTEYGSVEKAKEELYGKLNSRGFSISQPNHGFLDLKTSIPNSSTEIVGSVFVLEDERGWYTTDPPSQSERGPEHAASNTLYYYLKWKTYHEEAYEMYPDSVYIGFYKVPDMDLWLWYPFRENHDTGWRSEDRKYLTVRGPTNVSPMLSLDRFRSKYLNPERYEGQVEENWKAIERNRSIVSRYKDAIWRRVR